MDYYNVSPHGFFLWFFFSKWSLLIFFSYWTGWEFCFVVFFFKTPWIITMFPNMVFVLLQCFPTCLFFKIIFVEFFFNIELVENLALTFPTCFFSKLSLLIFFNIDLVENLALTFPTCFFFYFFSFYFAFAFPKLSSSFFIFFFIFCVFLRIVFVDFIFLIWSWLRI